MPRTSHSNRWTSRIPWGRCLNCHLPMKATDLVFTPFLNRPDPLPARRVAGADRIETLNYRFAPQVLRVKPAPL